MVDNKDRLENAKSLPYFVRDNEKYCPQMRITPNAAKGVAEAQAFNAQTARTSESKVERAIQLLVEKYRSKKLKTNGMLFSDITLGIANMIMKAGEKGINNREKTRILREITEMKIFTRVRGVKGKGSIFYFDKGVDARLISAGEIPKNLAAARKAALKGYDIFLLPNPHGGSSADSILRKEKKYYLYEIKTINGVGSLESRLNKSATQSTNVILDVADIYESRIIAEELKRFYETHSHIKDIILFRGKREIHITRSDIQSERFIRNFIIQWAKKK